MKPRDIKTLQWFAARSEPCALFGAGDPPLSSVRRLHEAGMLDTLPTKPGQFVSYQINDKGCAAIAPPKN